MPKQIPSFLFQSVRGRLVLLAGSIGIPGLILATGLTLQGYRNELASVSKTLQATSRAVARVVDGEIQEADTLLTGIASSNALAAGDIEGVETIARRALLSDERWLVVTAPDGRILLNTKHSRGGVSSAIIQADRLLATADEVPYASDLLAGEAQGTWEVYVTHLVRQAGHVKYRLSLGIDPSGLEQKLDIQRFASGSVLVILDRHGTIVARSHSSEKFVGGKATSDIVEAIARATDGVKESITLEGIPVLSAFSRARCGWTVVIGIPKSELFLPARHLLYWGLSCTVLLTVVALAVAHWISGALIDGVDALTTDSETMARGEMPVLHGNTLAEMELVASGMRRTADALLRRTRSLEALNRLSAKVVAERDPAKVMAMVVQSGIEITGASDAVYLDRQENAATSRYSVAPTPDGSKSPFGMSLVGPTLQWIESIIEGGAVTRMADVSSSSRSTALDSWTPPRGPRLCYNQSVPFAEPSTGVRSLLSAQVISSTGRIVGGLVFVHADSNAFTKEAEENVAGLAAGAAIAFENATLYQALQRELAAKTRAESELLSAQGQLRGYAHELEAKVEERTTSLREAVAQMEEFSYTVSHDLRSPLRGLIGYATVLLEEFGPSLNEEGREYLRRILRSSERMDRLTTDVLSYSRVARSQITLEATDVEKIVAGLVEHYAELNPKHSDVRVLAPLYPVLAHELSLTQSLANLLTNAAKFVRPGERPDITIRTELRGERVRIWIEDRGIGISQEYQAKLFKIFERAPTAQKYDGTGVGLAIVQKACEKMGGTCGAESDGLTGTQFWIELVAVTGR